MYVYKSVVPINKMTTTSNTKQSEQYEQKGDFLITCPNFINSLNGDNNYSEILRSRMSVYSYHCPNFTQQLSEEELLELVPHYRYWIAGDDPATRQVLEKGKEGHLRKLLKWGVGTDNVDIQVCKDLGIKFAHTPGMFGEEVSDLAMGYFISLMRGLHVVHKKAKEGTWHKYTGHSLNSDDLRVLVIGFGDIGKCLVKKLDAFGIKGITKLTVYDPGLIIDESRSHSDIRIYKPSYNSKTINIEKPYHTVKKVESKDSSLDYEFDFVNQIKDTNFTLYYDRGKFNVVFLCCALTPDNHHFVDSKFLSKLAKGAYIINVARGGLVKESDLVEALESGQVGGAALDVFENEPVTLDNPLHNYNIIFGAHNGSNTTEANHRTNIKILDLCWEL